MISSGDINKILANYDLKNLTIGVLGGHSALDVCQGAKKYGFRTLVVAQKGRENTYAKYFRTRDKETGLHAMNDEPFLRANGQKIPKGCVDEVILVEKFTDVLDEAVQKKLREMNTIFVHNRYFWVYFKDFSKVENQFKVPIFGLRQGVKMEERDQPLNQYDLLEKAGIRTPKVIKKAGEKLSEDDLQKRMDEHFSKGGAPMMIKAHEQERVYERDFFVVNDFSDFLAKRNSRIAAGKSSAEIIDNALIEEFVLGAQVNLNFFNSPLTGELELMGTDMRRQTDLDGFLRLTAKEQGEMLNFRDPKKIETGHVACTVKESLLEKIFALGEKFVQVCKKECAPGIIGPFALQGAVTAEEGKEDIVIFDVSMRIPGSPGTRFTPYSGYLYGENLSYGERIAMEIRDAVALKRLPEILT